MILFSKERHFIHLLPPPPTWRASGVSCHHCPISDLIEGDSNTDRGRGRGLFVMEGTSGLTFME